MKRREMRVLILGITVAVLVTGCSSRRVYVKEREPVYTTRVYTERPAEVVYVEPPSPRREVFGSPPSPSHVWVEGYWTYRDGKWVWRQGHWEVKPRPGAVYVPGHWDKAESGKGWIWVPGHWE